MGKILLFAGLIFGVLLGFEALAGAQALALTRQAPVSPAPSPVPVAGLSANPSLTQQSAGTWTTTVELDTAAICPGPVTFDLVTTKPYTDTTDAVPTYRQGGGVVPVGGCRAIGTSPVTEVELTFTPSPALAAIPEAATLAVTPSAAALALAPRRSISRSPCTGRCPSGSTWGFRSAAVCSSRCSWWAARW